MALLKAPQLPAHSVPPLDDRGGDTALPPLLSRAWWMFLNSLTGAVNSLSDSLDLLAGSVPLELVSTTQANLAALGPTLQTGALVEVTDYAHVLRWTGSAFTWGPGEEGSGMLVPFAAAPTGTGWHLCDGSAGVTYLKADGTTGTVTLPNTAATAAYLNLGPAYTNAITAAAVPTVSQPTFAGSPLAAHAHDAPVTNDGAGAVYSVNIAGTGGTYAASCKSAVGSLTSVNVAALKTNSVGAGTPAGTVSQPTASLPGDPVAHLSAPLWFRQ